MSALPHGRFLSAQPRHGRIAEFRLRTPSTVSTSARICGFVLAAALLPAAALANDSEAEWALGGLVLKRNEAISMQGTCRVIEH